MGIDKWYRRIIAVGGITTRATGVASVGALSVTGAASAHTLGVGSTVSVGDLIGNDRFRGKATVADGQTIITVSAADISVKSDSGILVSLGVVTQASHAHLGVSVNSLVDATSFAIVLSEAAGGANQEVVYLIIG